VTYLEPPQQVGDDETTIVFTQNMKRISHTTEAIEQEDDGETNNKNNATMQDYRHGHRHLCDKPVTTANLNPTVAFTCQDCEQPRDEQDDPEEQERQQLMNYFLITTILQDMASLPPNHPVWRGKTPPKPIASSPAFFLPKVSKSVNLLHGMINKST
jgi:hypothetical protein